MRGLTRLQRQVAAIVLEVAEPYGFALAGGAGLIAAGLSPRPTEDIDAFSWAVDDVRPAADAVSAALRQHGFDVEPDRTGPNFVRIFVVAGAARRRRRLKVELSRDQREWPLLQTRIGPVLSPRELAANKVLALFSRSVPRDLCDVATLSAQMDLEEIFSDAKIKDPGFSRPILAEMVRLNLGRPDQRWPPKVDVGAVRLFGEKLAKALEAGESVSGLQPDTAIWPD